MTPANPVTDGPAALSVLELVDVSVRFGGVNALQKVSMSLPASVGISAIIGPNGAGKTTLFNVICGLVAPQEGKVLLLGRDMTRRRPDEIYRARLARTFQGVRLFENLTLFDNVLLAASSARGRESVSSNGTAGRRDAAARTEAALEQVGLDRSLWTRFPSELSVVQAKFAEIARAISSQPAALLLDEPGAGLNPAEKLSLCDTLRGIAQAYQCRVVLVEHDMKLVMSVSELIWVMDFGRVLAHGTPQEIQDNPAVVDAYLGAQTDD